MLQGSDCVERSWEASAVNLVWQQKEVLTKLTRDRNL